MLELAHKFTPPVTGLLLSSRHFLDNRNHLHNRVS